MSPERLSDRPIEVLIPARSVASPSIHSPSPQRVAPPHTDREWGHIPRISLSPCEVERVRGVGLEEVDVVLIIRLLVV